MPVPGRQSSMPQPRTNDGSVHVGTRIARVRRASATSAAANAATSPSAASTSTVSYASAR